MSAASGKLIFSGLNRLTASRLINNQRTALFPWLAKEIGQKNKGVKMNEQRFLNSFHIPKVNSYAYGVSLYKEVTTIDDTMVYQSFNEQRKCPRFKPDTKMFILHSSLGTVKDIGIDGLTYTYYHLPKETSTALPDVGIIFSAGQDYLLDIPFTVVSDTVVRESYSSFPELKQRRIHFDGLTKEHLLRLEQFILTHAIVPQFDTEEEIHTTDRDTPGATCP